MCVSEMEVGVLQMYFQIRGMQLAIHEYKYIYILYILYIR